MTHEQMVAWLILEGWEYFRDEDKDHWGNMIREVTPLPDERFLCEMLLSVHGHRKCVASAKGANLHEYRPLSSAPARIIETFYSLAQEKQNDT